MDLDEAAAVIDDLTAERDDAERRLEIVTRKHDELRVANERLRAAIDQAEMDLEFLVSGTFTEWPAPLHVEQARRREYAGKIIARLRAALDAVTGGRDPAPAQGEDVQRRETPNEWVARVQDSWLSGPVGSVDPGDEECDHVFYNGVCQRCNDLQPLPTDEGRK